jgi:GMP synthase-like glutamine amidotransferase
MGADAWVLKMQKFLQNTVSQFPAQKIVGICWGHQTIGVAFGATVDNLPKLEIGVTDIELTDEGRKMFPFAEDGIVRMHEYHRRYIKGPAKGFVRLGEGNQSFVNEKNTILTFQGHPEMTESVAKAMLDDTPGYMGLDESEIEAIEQRMELPHDGGKIWKRILEWVHE